jgi:F-type H+-transporting ATPase subunit epsilon
MAVMVNSMYVDIVSAEAEIFSGTATMVVVPALMGEMGILPAHSPLLTRLRPGEVRIYPVEGGELLIYVSGGLLEIQPFSITVLADTALRAEGIDEEAARKAQQYAERELRRAEKASAEGLPVLDYAKAKAELAKAIAQLRTVEDLRRRKRKQPV